jgi:hypothetical protein
MEAPGDAFDSSDSDNFYDGVGYGDNPDDPDDPGNDGSDEDSLDGSNIGDSDDKVPSYDGSTRFLKLDDIDPNKHITKYLSHQNSYLKGVYGSSLEDVNSINSFKKTVSLFV